MFDRTWTDRLLLLLAKTHCRRVLKRFFSAAERAEAVQNALLLQRIRRNRDSDYGRDHGFAAIRSYEDFARAVPLQTYDDLEPYIERLLHGAHDALFGGGQKVRMFALTSGTAGRPKHIPVTDAFLAEFRAGWNAFGFKALMDHEDGFLRPIVQITSRMDERRSPAGIPCGAITGLMAASQKHLVRKYYLTPLEVAHIQDPLARYYTIMRLAVAVEDVAFMVTANPATPLRLAKTAVRHAVQLIRDIHDGTLWDDLPLPGPVRAALALRLHANPHRAGQLEKLLERHGELLPRHYWRLRFMCNWTAGTLGLFLKEFPRYFGDTPVRDIGLIASEGRMSVPVHDGTPAGILDVTSNFYEFIPSAQFGKPQPDCRRCWEVDVGGEYFIVLTNSAGLYRYSIGDRVRVLGFQGRSPIIEFLDRGDHVCSLAGEKLTEHQVVNGIGQAIADSGLRVLNYVLAPQWQERPCYLLHVELGGQRCAGDLQRLVRDADRRLAELNIEYGSKRESLRLGAVQLNVLPGGFLEKRDQMLSRQFRPINEQYKHQFLLTQPGQDGDFPRAPAAEAVATEPAARQGCAPEAT